MGGSKSTNGCGDLVVVAHASLGMPGLLAVWTMYFIGGKMFAAVQRNKIFSAEESISVQLPVIFY